MGFKIKDSKLKIPNLRLQIQDSEFLIFNLQSSIDKGFTLIELMLVIIIIGTLAAMVMPRLVGRAEQAKVAAAQADINTNIATAIKLYEVDNGTFPTTEEGLDVLLNKPATTTRWNGPYLEREPIDPWGKKYQYECPGKHRTYDYDLYSMGKDGKVSDDDITNWE